MTKEIPSGQYLEKNSDREFLEKATSSFSPGGVGYKTLCRLLGNIEDARDAAQQILLKLSRKPAKENVTELEAYFKTIARNHVNDLVRARTRRISLVSDVGLNIDLPDSSAPHNKPEHLLVKLDKITASIEKVLSQLPPHFAELLRLSYFEGKKSGEIVKLNIMGKTYHNEATVRSAIQRARELFIENYNKLKTTDLDMADLTRIKDFDE